MESRRCCGHLPGSRPRGGSNFYKVQAQLLSRTQLFRECVRGMCDLGYVQLSVNASRQELQRQNADAHI